MPRWSFWCMIGMLERVSTFWARSISKIERSAAEGRTQPCRSIRVACNHQCSSNIAIQAVHQPASTIMTWASSTATDIQA